MAFRVADLRVGLARKAIRPRREWSAALAIVVVWSLASTGATVAAALGWRVLLRPLPYPTTPRLVLISQARPGDAAPERGRPLDSHIFDALADQASVFSGIAAYASAGRVVAPDLDADPLRAEFISAAAFRLLAMTPAVGRAFTNEEERSGSLVALIGYGAWRRMYGADPSVLGRPLDHGSRRYRIIGVMPEGFGFPDGTTDAWLPVPGGHARTRQNIAHLFAIGILTPRLTVDDARRVLAGDLHDAVGRPAAVLLESLYDRAISPFRLPLALAAGAAALSLVVALGTVIGLQLAMLLARRDDVWIRRSLGASGRQALQPFFIQAALLAVACTSLGLTLTYSASGAAEHLRLVGLPRVEELTFGADVAAFAVLLCMSGPLGGATLASIVVRTRLESSRHSAGPWITETPRASILRDGLLLVQIAMSVVLCGAAGLLANSLYRVVHTHPGFVRNDMFTVQLSPRQTDRASLRLAMERASQTADELLERISGPDVLAAGVASSLPTGDTALSFSVTAEIPHAGTYRAPTRICGVRGDYFAAMGIPIVEGRAFSAGDELRAEVVSIVDTTFAAETFGAPSNAVGQTVRILGRLTRIVGVVPPVRQDGLLEPPPAMIYVPFRPFPLPSAFALVVRHRGSDARSTLRTMLLPLRDRFRIGPVLTMDERLGGALVGKRVAAATASVLAILAWALAAIGVYGAVRYAAGRRTREMAIRLAVGAAPLEVVYLVMRRVLLISVAAVGAGLAGALAAGTALAGLLHAVDGRDVPTLTVVAALCLGGAAAAAGVPALHAARVDPSILLRE